MKLCVHWGRVCEGWQQLVVLLNPRSHTLWPHTHIDTHNNTPHPHTHPETPLNPTRQAKAMLHHFEEQRRAVSILEADYKAAVARAKALLDAYKRYRGVVGGGVEGAWGRVCVSQAGVLVIVSRPCTLCCCQKPNHNQSYYHHNHLVGTWLLLD